MTFIAVKPLDNLTISGNKPSNSSINYVVVNQSKSSQQDNAVANPKVPIPSNTSSIIAATGNNHFIKASYTSSGYVWISSYSDNVRGMRGSQGAGVENPTYIFHSGELEIFHITNQDEQTHSLHNFNIDDFNLHSNDLSPYGSENQTLSFLTNQSGTFQYYCKIHPEMRGQIVIEPSQSTIGNNHYIKAATTSSGYVWISTSSNSVIGMSGRMGAGVENPNYLFKKGDIEVFHITNGDQQTHSLHNFNLDEFGVNSRNLTANGSDSQTLVFVADIKGTYGYYCSIHPEMRGKITIQ